MVQDHNPDGHFPFHDPQNPGSENPVHQPDAQQGSPSEQPASEEASWLMEGDHSMDEPVVLGAASEQLPSFGGPPPGGVRVDPPQPEPVPQAADESSWLMSDEQPEGPAPLPAQEPAAGDGPAFLEASYVADDPVGSAAKLLVPVSIGAVLLFGGLAAVRLGLVGSDDTQDRPTAVKVTQDLHKETELVGPDFSDRVDPASTTGSRRSIGRDGKLGAPVPQGEVAMREPETSTPVVQDKEAPAKEEPLQVASLLPAPPVESTPVKPKAIPRPLGTPPPPAWDQIPSKAEVLALAGQGTPTVGSAEETAESIADLLAAADAGDQGPVGPSEEERELQREAELLAWLEAEEDLPFLAMGSLDMSVAADDQPEMLPPTADSAPEPVTEEAGDQQLAASEAPAQESVSVDLDGETTAALVIEPGSLAASVEPGMQFSPLVPLTLEPLFPDVELDPFGLDDLSLADDGLSTPAFEPSEYEDAFDAPFEDELAMYEKPIELPVVEPFLVHDWPGSYVETGLAEGPVAEEEQGRDQLAAVVQDPSPSDDFWLGPDPVQWAAERDLDQSESQEIEDVLAMLEAELEEDAEAAAGAEAPPSGEGLSPEVAALLALSDEELEVERQANGLEVGPLLEGQDAVSTEAPTLELEEGASEDLTAMAGEQPAELLESSEVADSTGPAIETDSVLEEAEGELLSAAGAEVDTDEPLAQVGPVLDADVLAQDQAAEPSTEATSSLAYVEAEPRSLLEAYSDWMRIQDMAPAGSLVQGGLTGVTGHRTLPYGMAQQSVDSEDAISMDRGVEVGASGAPRRGGVLRRASGDHRWDGVEVPDHAVGVERKLLTPNVGLVRVELVDGEGLEGRLHAVGFEMIWLETSLGRMSLEDRRVAKIHKLDQTHVLTAPGAKRDYSSLPRVRVTAKGGSFVGHQLSRDGNRITIVTDEGSRITLENVEVMPARQYRPVGLRRTDEPGSGGSAASPK